MINIIKRQLVNNKSQVRTGAKKYSGFEIVVKSEIRTARSLDNKCSSLILIVVLDERL